MPKPPQHIAHETLVLAESLYTLCLASRVDLHGLFAATAMLHALLLQRVAELDEEQAEIAQLREEE